MDLITPLVVIKMDNNGRKHQMDMDPDSDMDMGHNVHIHSDNEMIQDLKKRFLISIILTIPILILSPFIQGILGIERFLHFPYQYLLLFVLSSIVYFYGGFPFFRGFYKDILNHEPGMDTLITVAITTAYFYSTAVVFGLQGGVFFWELATLIDIMLIGHWLEMKSVMGASNAIEELVKLMPSHATKLMANGKLISVPISQLDMGDMVVVKPGEKLPVDGLIVDGNSHVDESMITGESKPVFKSEGNDVIGGSINQNGSITIKIMNSPDKSYLSQVIELVKKAQNSKSKTQDLANRYAMWLTIVTLLSGTLTFVVWYMFDQDLSFSIERAVTVMVIACPHALGLAVPLVIAVSSALAAKNGLLIRNRTAFENARNIGAVVFDKTGTLTFGEFGITDLLTLDDMDSDEILKYVTSLENYSEHPLSKPFAKMGTEKLKVENFQTMPGYGIEGYIEGNNVKVVGYNYIKQNSIEFKNEKLDRLLSEGKTVIFLVIDGILKASIALADIIRPESKQAVSLLKDLSIKCIMITGDREPIAQWVSREVGLNSYYAEVLPHQKAQKIIEIQSEGVVVAMAGDGINDAPALAQADVGVAIGAGTDVAIEAGDIVLVKSNPLDVVNIVELSRSTYRKMVENLIWGTGYNIFAIPAAAGILITLGIVLTPAAGAILMSLSTIIVAVNSRFLTIK